MKALRDEEAALRAKDEAFFEENRRIVKSITENIAEGMANETADNGRMAGDGRHAQ